MCMRKGGWIVGGIVTLGLYLSYRTWNVKESVKFFQYGINGLKLNLSNILAPEVMFNVTVYNPNKTSVPISDVFGVVKIQNNIISNFKSTAGVNINGEETKSIPIRARISALSIISTVFSKTKIAEVVVEGMVKTPYFDFPINKTLQLKT